MSETTTIVVIEDETIIRKQVVYALTSEGYSVLAAGNGREGLELIKRSMPDLVVSDVMMPEMNGYEVLTEVRRYAPTAAIPFLFMSAKASKSDIRQGMNIGADDYIIKPFDPDEFLMVVKTRLIKHRAIVHQADTKLEYLRSSISLSLPHEFRTPLNSIIGFAEIMQSGVTAFSEPEIRTMAAHILASAKRLSHLTEKFLHYIRLELVFLRPEELRELQHHRTPSAVSWIEDTTRALARSANRSEDVIIDAEDSTVAIDEKDFEKLLEELIDNALKFSEIGTQILVKGRCMEDKYILTIADNGRGMTTEQIDSIAAFVQFDREMYEQQGQGLGLILCKRIAEIYGGRLMLKSVIGVSTEVIVELRREVQYKKI